jgi:hypothetical protein
MGVAPGDGGQTQLTTTNNRTCLDSDLTVNHENNLLSNRRLKDSAGGRPSRTKDFWVAVPFFSSLNVQR